MEKLDEAYELKEKLDEVTSYLNSRDQDYKVQFYMVLSISIKLLFVVCC